jgi:murein DD-endopeptidase MepM/ murein hydrolase activator NlpD
MLVMGRLVLVSLVTFALAVVAPAAGQEDPSTAKARVDQHISQLQAEIDAAQAQEGVLTSQLSEIATELRAAQSAVDEAQATLDRLEAELATEQLQLERLTQELRIQTKRLVSLQREYVHVVAVLEQRVRAIYIHEQPDALAFILSAASFSDLIDNYEFEKRIGEQDQQIVREVQAAKKKAAAERKATIRTRTLTEAVVSVISARTADARSLRDRLVVNRDTLSAAQRLKQSAIDSARESRAEYLSEVDALAAQSAALAAAIQGAQGVAGSTSTGAPSAAGLIWPINGPVTSGFGMRWGRMHEGIDIAAAIGTPVHAAADGTVIYASWMTGYGNLVVVDHGNGLATAYAHASALVVRVGQAVSQGQTVSLVGSTGNSTGPHLHFEVRVNGVAVDPLLYL